MVDANMIDTNIVLCMSTRTEPKPCAICELEIGSPLTLLQNKPFPELRIGDRPVCANCGAMKSPMLTFLMAEFFRAAMEMILTAKAERKAQLQ